VTSPTWKTIQYTDDDFRWVARQLGLPELAFIGEDGRDPRRDVLADLGNLDVPACPGSGKTTLLVAKLALLLRDWKQRGQGICVISHTNVARREIEDKLGPASGGHRLLAYPHYVGTIHGFVNQFLAGPSLRSVGVSPRLIDDTFANRVRLAKLPENIRKGLGNAGVEIRNLYAQDVDGDLGEIKWGKGTLGRDSDTYKALQAAFAASMVDGYLRYDEIFLWAERLLERAPSLVDDIRRRFPIVFIDEVQDTTEAQARLINRLFAQGGEASVRQRFGDMNQAIFGSADTTAEVASTDGFPRDGCTRPVPNSHRFCATIAALADPVAPAPAGLIGMRASPAEPGHAVFLFDRSAAQNVLPAFARRILSHVPATARVDGRFTAIGHVHKPRADGTDHLVVGDYCAGYDHERSGLDVRPSRFIQYIGTPRSRRGDVHRLVDQTAEAVLRLARLADPDRKLPGRQRRHLAVLESIGENERARRFYLGLLERIARGQAPTNEREWREKWVPRWLVVASAIAGREPEDIGAFLDWSDSLQGAATPATNALTYVHELGSLKIEVGSIHAAKGETHTATLVLETFFKRNHLAVLKPWLLGVSNGAGRSNLTTRNSMKQHYVAMTRPTHLLCLAMDAADVSDQEAQALIARNWAVARVTADGERWI
jgi:DNA helicase-2/ATP-dependent DNA helicase PcrA